MSTNTLDSNQQLSPTFQSNKKKNLRRAKVIGLSAVIGGAAMLAINGGLLAAETATSQVQQSQFSAGTFNIEIQPGTLATKSDSLSNMAAGDSASRSFVLHNSSDVAVGTVDVNSKVSGPLFAGATPATLTLTGCMIEFSAQGECATPVAVVASASNSASNKISVNVPPQGSMFLMVSTKLPTTANSDYAGKSGSINYTFKATQAVPESNLPQPESR